MPCKELEKMSLHLQSPLLSFRYPSEHVTQTVGSSGSHSLQAIAVHSKLMKSLNQTLINKLLMYGNPK